MTQPLVSIIIPVFNSEKFLKETIKTVLDQTYQNWELLLINDCSVDNSKKIAQPFLSKKIKWIDLDKNSGPAIARNKGIERAKGDYICFLDADDLWKKNKLEKQVQFMQKKDCAFSFTGYEFANEAGEPNGKKVTVPEKIDYVNSLKNTIIWTSTVMLNMQKLKKDNIFMPNIKRGQDTATWWKILRKIDYAYGFNKILSYYRRSSNSLSANKLKALRRTWYLYRNIEKLSPIKSTCCFIAYCFNAIKKRI